MGANVKMSQAMAETSKTMTNMNKLMNPAQVSKTMQEFDMANTKMGMTEEMMNDALDDILTESGDEEEGDAIVNQVLDEIGIEISGKVCKNIFSLLRNISIFHLDVICSFCSQRYSRGGDNFKEEQGGRRGNRKDASSVKILKGKMEVKHGACDDTS